MRRAPAVFIRSASLTLLLIFLPGCSLFSRAKPQSVPNDATLHAQVTNALSRDHTLQGEQIAVRSLEGVIDLSGTVKSPAIKARAGLVAASIPGVVQVHNDLLTPSPRVN